MFPALLYFVSCVVLLCSGDLPSVLCIARGSALMYCSSVFGVCQAKILGLMSKVQVFNFHSRISV